MSSDYLPGWVSHPKGIMDQMKRYLLRTPTSTRRAMSLEAIEQLLRHIPSGTPWALVVDYPHGSYPLRSGVGPRL